METFINYCEKFAYICLDAKFVVLNGEFSRGLGIFPEISSFQNLIGKFVHKLCHLETVFAKQQGKNVALLFFHAFLLFCGQCHLCNTKKLKTDSLKILFFQKILEITKIVNFMNNLQFKNCLRFA